MVCRHSVHDSRNRTPSAQEAAPGPGTVEVTVIPGGGTFFTSGDKGQS
jgi:hypothetical protein